MQNSFTLTSRFRSLFFAARGIGRFFMAEPNAMIHLAATVFVFFLMMILPLSTVEMVLLFFVIGLVWMAELFNTAIENLCDKVEPGFDINIGYIKDISAAAVLVCSLVALVTALLILYPKIF